MSARWLVAFSAFLVTPGIAAELSSASLPFLNEEARARIEKEYVPAQQPKALAMTETGRWHFTSRAADLDAARQRALALCQDRNPRYPCFVAAENDELVLQERYTPEAIYARAVEILKNAALSLEYYANENRDAGVASTKSFRMRDVHAPTPLAVPGAKTITTRELVELLKTSRPVLVNVLGWREGAFAIPGTVWIQGMGRQLYRGEVDELQTALAKVAPDKSAPLVLYCLSWECWLSYNATLNALQLGYTNVLWYRGGGEAWDQANLPVVRTKLYKQL